MPDLVLSTKMTVRQAVVDDTQRLWIAFTDGVWLWVDLAGYLDDYGSSEPLPYRPTQHGLNLRLTPDIVLPLPVLFWPREVALQRGIYVCAARQSWESWYRPLHLTQRVHRTQHHHSTHWLAHQLLVTPEQLQQAASAHAVPLRTFLRRLTDLHALLQHAGWPAAEVLQAPQRQLQASRGAMTLWNAIARGQIGLAEQLLVAQAERAAPHPVR